MRRTYGGQYNYNQNGHRNYVEAENEEMEDELRHKVHALKSLSIDIGAEVRSQNEMISNMENDFEGTGGILQRTMNRVIKLSKGGHNYYILYLFLFAVFVFVVLWFVIRF